MSDPRAGITNVDIDKEMREAYLQYSMSVIVGRALPDVRDGLKPVHRRVLFAQNEMSNTHDKPYKKSARIVGDVIGKYHPHGDTSVYDTMVRMAQEFSLRYPMEDGQGNFGSIDGDSPAAMRYTEIRMTQLAEQLLEDIEKNTVPFGPNYDDSLMIPLVLPAKFPNLLVNGSAGIAVGMATSIPPHNLGEVIDGCTHLIENPDCTIDDLMKFIPAPDFPTGATISGQNGIHQAYKKGRGSVTMKAVTEIETKKDGREEIVVTEIPYQVNKSRLIETMADLVREKVIEGISDIRDESSREGMRIVISLKRAENASVTLNRLFKHTQLQTNFTILLLALDASNQPVTFNLKSMLEAFVDHRRQVVTKRTLFDLQKAEDRLHILEGLRKALDQIDAVIQTIRASNEASLANQNLRDQFGFSEKQAQAILEMRLQRLTGLEREKIDNEFADLLNLIGELNKILASAREVDLIILKELTDIRAKYGDARRSKIVAEEGELEDEDLIAHEDVVVTITNTGYIKRIPLDEYRLQKRGGKGLRAMETREEDYVTQIFMADTKTNLMIFTDKGRLFTTKVYRVPQGNRMSKGKSIANMVQFQSNEKAISVLPIEKFDENRFLVMVTKYGVIKKTELSAFAQVNRGGIIALSVDEDDILMDAKISNGEQEIFIVTREGMSIRFNESQLRPMGRTARGVRGVQLETGDQVVSTEVLDQDFKDTILLVTEKGYGKRSEIDDYRKQNRAGSGVIAQKVTERTGSVVAARRVRDDQEIILTTDQGQTIRTRAIEIRLTGRNTQGVRLMNLDNRAEKVTSFTVVDADEVPLPPEGGALPPIVGGDDFILADDEGLGNEGTGELLAPKDEEPGDDDGSGSPPPSETFH